MLPFLIAAPAALIGAGVALLGTEADKMLSDEDLKGAFFEGLSSEKEKVEFVKGIIRLAKVDQKIALEEKSFLDELVVRIGLDSKYIPEFRKLLFSKDDLSTIKVSFDNKKKSILFLREAIQLCKVDGEYHEKEKAEIDKIAKEMGVSANAVKEIEDWADKGIQWQKDGIKLLNLE